MKKNIILSCIFAAALAFAGCTEKEQYTPGEVVEGYWFDNNTPSVIEVSDGMTSVGISLLRDKTEAAESKVVTITDESKLFFPQGTATVNVPFAAGSEKAVIDVPFKFSDLEIAKEYPLEFKFTGDETPYGPSSLKVSILSPEPWTVLGEGLYTEAFIDMLFGTDNIEYSVEVSESGLYAGKYRIKNPYGVAFGYNEEGNFDASKDYYMVINAHDPERVFIERYYSEMDWGYGTFIFSSYAYEFVNQGVKTADEVAEMGLYGTNDGGVITFPVNSLLVAMADYNNASFFDANASGKFRLVLPGVEIKDYEVSVGYVGTLLDPKANPSVVLNVGLGADVSTAKAVLVSGDDAEAALQLIVDGDESVIDVEETGDLKVPVDIDTPSGKMTAVVASIANDEVQDAAFVTFVYVKPGDSADPLAWEYSFSDMIGPFTKDDLLNTDWTYFGQVMQVNATTGSPEGYDDLEMLGSVEIEDAEDIEEDGETYDVITIKGLSAGVAEAFDGDDTFPFIYYEYDEEEESGGFIVSDYPTDLSSFEYKGTTFYLIPEWGMSDGYGYDISNAVIGCLVDDGIIAFVDSGAYASYGMSATGEFLYEAFEDPEDYHTSIGEIFRYGNIKLGDASIYGAPEDEGEGGDDEEDDEEDGDDTGAGAPVAMSKAISRLNKVASLAANRTNFVQTERAYLRSCIEKVMKESKAERSEVVTGKVGEKKGTFSKTLLVK